MSRPADMRALHRRIAAALLRPAPAPAEPTSGRKLRRVYEARPLSPPPDPAALPLLVEAPARPCHDPAGIPFLDLPRDRCRAFLPGEAGHYGRCCGLPVEGGKGLAADSYCRAHRTLFIVRYAGRVGALPIARDWIAAGRDRWYRMDAAR